MRSELSQRLLRTPPAALICVVILIKAALLLLLIPGIQSAIANSYGLGFTDDYDVLGRNLANGLGYRFFPDTAPTMMREPGYPLLLAGLFHFFGYSLTAARIVNLILAFVASLSISRLARRITGNELVLRLAPLLFLIHPGILATDARGGVESLFIMLLLLYFEALYTALERGRLANYAVAGLLLGLSATVRSTALLFPFALAFYFLLWRRESMRFLGIGARLAIMMTTAVLVLTPWTIRNYLLVGTLQPTASVAGVSAYAGYHICTHLTFHNTFYQVDAEAGTARANIARSAGLRFKPLGSDYYQYFFDSRDEIAFNKILTKKVVQDYRAHPLLFASCATKNLFHFWFSGKNWTVTALNAAIQLPYIILAGIGLTGGLRGNRRALFAPLLLFILYTLGVYVPILAQARYSMHLIPFLAILAALPVTRYLSSDRQGN